MMAIRMQAPVPNNKMTLKTAMHLLPEHLPTQINIPMNTKQAIDPINPKHSKVLVAVNQSPTPNLISVSIELQESVILLHDCHNPTLPNIPLDQYGAPNPIIWRRNPTITKIKANLIAKAASPNPILSLNLYRRKIYYEY